jgi:protein-disulfide isomerase
MGDAVQSEFVMRLSDIRRAARHVLVIGAVLASGSAAAALVQGPDAAPIDTTVAGMMGKEPLTVADIIASDETEFHQLQSDYERSQQNLRFKYAKSRYDLLQKQAEKLLDQRALEAEAKARGITTAEVLRAIRPGAPVTDAEAHSFYDAHKERIGAPFEQVALQIRVFMAQQRNDAATRAFYDALRAKHGISSQLAPYTVQVAAIGPSRGPGDAPVTIVEFGDFQCPYCKQAEASLGAILAQYPRQVRLVFRNLPLDQLHPNAEIAAKAAVCADRQGNFWPMHDAMYADQSQLGVEGLNGTAKRLHLDADRFSACLADASSAAAVAADTKAADDLGISGTPFFFINGQPIDGSVPVEQFQQVIDSELRRLQPSDKTAGDRTPN